MEVENNGAGQAPVEDRRLADEAQLLGIFPEEVIFYCSFYSQTFFNICNRYLTRLVK